MALTKIIILGVGTCNQSNGFTAIDVLSLLFVLELFAEHINTREAFFSFLYRWGKNGWYTSERISV